MGTMRQAAVTCKPDKSLSARGIFPLLLSLLPAMLSGCSAVEMVTGPSEPQYCPKPAILGEADEIHRFRAGTDPDPGNLVFEGRIIDMGLTCYGRGNQMTVEMAVLFDLRQGPGAEDLSIWLEYFLAYVDENNEVLNKQSYSRKVDFPNALGSVQVQEDVDFHSLIRGEAKKIPSHRVLVGFRLRPDEIRYNSSLR